MPTDKIVTKNLNVWIDSNHILKDVNVRIPEKQVTVIIGPSGCGKTTLLKCFNRLVELSERVRIKGEVLVDGKDIYDPRVDVIDVRKKMGLLAQKPAPLPMSIYENVAYGPRLHNNISRDELDRRVEHYLKTTGLWAEVKNRLKDPATRLSIGQQQRLCLARGLAVEPEVILCDEPTSALDPMSAKRIEELLKKLKSRYTIILVTHTLRQAKRIADHAIFIYSGEIIEQGPAKDVFYCPKQKRTKAYMDGDIS